MPDDLSEVVPLLPIPNRTVKRFSADDSADSRVKVGHCQAIKVKTPGQTTGRFFWQNYSAKSACRLLLTDQYALAYVCLRLSRNMLHEGKGWLQC